MSRLSRFGWATLWALWLAMPILTVAAPADAQDASKIAGKKLKRRKAKLAQRKKWVVMSVGWRDVVNAKIRKKLLSGLPTVIATRAYLFPEGGDQPITLSIKTCRVVFDLWDEVFRIELREGGTRRNTVAVNVEGVLRRCARAKHMPLVSLAAVDASKRYFVGVLVEVNPLSKQMMERIKRWVARPKGAGAVSPGDSLFGSFVGLFITQVPEADRVLMFRTQSFVPSSLPELVSAKDASAKWRRPAPFGPRSVHSGSEPPASADDGSDDPYDDPADMLDAEPWSAAEDAVDGAAEGEAEEPASPRPAPEQDGG